MSQQDTQFYVSIKGVIIVDDGVLLLRKLNGEWDLPGGRLSIDESPKLCLIREVKEETSLSIIPGKLLHRWVRPRPGNVDVFVVSHLCGLENSSGAASLSHEHDKLGWFTMQEFEAMPISNGVRKSVRRAFRSLQS